MALPPAEELRGRCSAFDWSCDQQVGLPGWAVFWHGSPSVFVEPPEGCPCEAHAAQDQVEWCTELLPYLSHCGSLRFWPTYPNL